MKIINVVAFDESVLFNVDSNVPAYKANAETGAMEQTEDTSFSMSYSDLARQCYPLNADIAELRSLRGQHLSGEDWIKLLTGATITVDFKFVNENDEVDGYTYENSGYIKTIKSLRLNDRVAARLDRALGFQSSIVCGVHRDTTDIFKGITLITVVPLILVTLPLHLQLVYLGGLTYQRTNFQRYQRTKSCDE